MARTCRIGSSARMISSCLWKRSSGQFKTWTLGPSRLTWFSAFLKILSPSQLLARMACTPLRGRSKCHGTRKILLIPRESGSLTSRRSFNSPMKARALPAMIWITLLKIFSQIRWNLILLFPTKTAFRAHSKLIISRKEEGQGQVLPTPQLNLNLPPIFLNSQISTSTEILIPTWGASTEKISTSTTESGPRYKIIYI